MRPFRRLLVAPLFVLIAAPLPLTAQSGGSGPELLRRAHAQLREAGLLGDRALQAARARLAAAEFATQAAGAPTPVHLDVQITDGPRFDVPAGNATAILSRGLALGGRRSAARALADATRRAAAEEVQVREREINALALLQLTRAAADRQALTRLARATEWLSEAERSVTARFAAGQASFTEVLRLRGERLRLQAEAAARGTALADGLAELTLLVGDALGEQALTALVDTVSAVGVADWRALLPDLPRELSSMEVISAELHDALSATERAEAELDVVRAAQRTAMTGGLGLQRIGPFNGGPAVGLVLGFSSSLPFTAREGNMRREAASSAAVRSAQARVERVRAETRTKARASAVRYTAALERLRSFDDALFVAAANEREAALAQYRNGQLSLLELLDFEQALLRVDVERFRTVVTAAEARAALLGLVPSLGTTP